MDGFSNFKKVNWSEFRALSIGIITWIRLDPDPYLPKGLYLDPDLDPPPKKFGSETLPNIISILKLVAIYLDAKIVIVTTERHTTHNHAFGLFM